MGCKMKLEELSAAFLGMIGLAISMILLAAVSNLAMPNFCWGSYIPLRNFEIWGIGGFCAVVFVEILLVDLLLILALSLYSVYTQPYLLLILSNRVGFSYIGLASSVLNLWALFRPDR